MDKEMDDKMGLVWGVGAIAKLIGRTHSATYHMCEKGQLPARRIGRRWVAKREALERFFEETAA